MAMSKKDFIAIADKIKEHNRVASARLANGIAATPFTDDPLDTIAEFCQQQNPRFMPSRWRGYILGLNGPNGGAR